jgi:hypothetical protein
MTVQSTSRMPIVIGSSCRFDSFVQSTKGNARSGNEDAYENLRLLRKTE